MTSRRRPASRLAGGGGGLLVLAASLPRDAASFSHPRRRTFLRARDGSPWATTALSAQPTYLDPAHPLESIAGHPDLFPTTSAYVRALQSSQADVPSAEEFLTQLSTELLRASREGAVAFRSGEAAGDLGVGGLEQIFSPVYEFAEQTVPAFASAAAVTVAAEGYDPSLYANVNQLTWGMQMADAGNDLEGAPGNGLGNSTKFAATTSYSTAVADRSSLPADAGNGVEGATGNGLEGYATEYAASSNSAEFPDASSYSTPITDASSLPVPPDASGGSESFATWHSQGGSNALRDLASSIPRVEQQDTSYLSSQGVSGGMSDYGSYLAENNVNVGPQMMQNVVGSGSGFDAGTVANAYKSSSIGLGDAAASYSDVASAAASAYLAMDAPMEGVADQVAAPGASNEVADALSSQLSDLNYNGMQIDGDAAATKAFSSAKPPRPELLSDAIKEKLGHFEMPKVSNPFSEMQLSSSPSMERALSSVKEAGGASKEKLDTLLNSMSHSFDRLGDKVADATHSLEGLSGQLGKVADSGASGFKALGNAVQSGASSVGEGLAGMSSSVKSAGEGVAGMAASAKGAAAGVQAPNLNSQAPTMPQVNVPPPELPNVNVNIPQPNLPSVNIQPPTLPEWNIGEQLGGASLSDLGNSVISAVKFIGGIIVKFLDFVLGALAGTSVSSIMSNVQASVTSAIDNASHTVVSIINSIGDLSIKEIIQHLMALTIAIADILLKIANAVIYIISGKDAGDWVLQATSTVNDASSQLMAYASTTYDDVTHATLSEMAHTVGDYSQYVGNELVALVGNLNGMAQPISLKGVPLDADTINGVTTAVETALNM